MIKKLYFIVIYFLGMTIAAGIFNGIIRFQLGSKIIRLSSFFDWFLVMNMISLLGSVLVLKYYHHKKYWSTLTTGSITTLASFCTAVIFYTMYASVQLLSYYIPSLIFTTGAGIIYGFSLIFSISGRRPWLRIAGVFTFMLNAVLLSTTIWWMTSLEIRMNGTIEKINQWTYLAISLVPALIIINMLSELRSIKSKERFTSMQEYIGNGLLIVGAITFVLALFYGGMMISEKTSFINKLRTEEFYEKRNYDLAQGLARLFEPRIFVGGEGDTLPYRLLIPHDYDPGKKYPLMVCLHHGGVHGNDNIRQLSSQPAPFLSRDFNRTKYSAFLFVPQCPKGSTFGRRSYYPSIDSLVFEAINALEREFNIDERRRYVAGLSGGGFGTWHFISAHPEMFAAAIPMSGGGDPKFAPNLTDVAIWAFHGKKDIPVPVRLSRDMIEAIKKAGGNPRYTEFPNDGHGIWTQVKYTPGLWDWLFEQKRDKQERIQ